MHKTLSHSCSTDEEESEGIIANETLSQSYSTDEGRLCSTEEDKSEYAIMKQKGAKNEVTYDEPNHVNAFKIF